MRRGDPTRCPLIGPRHSVVLSTGLLGGTECGTRPRTVAFKHHDGAQTSRRDSIVLFSPDATLVGWLTSPPRLSPLLARLHISLSVVSRAHRDCTFATARIWPPNRERGSEGRKSEWRTGPDECQGNVRWRHPAEGHIAYVWPCPFPASCGHAQRRGSLGPRARSAASTLSCTRPSSGAWLAAAPSLSLSPLLSAPGLHPPCLPPSLLPLRAPWRSLGDPAGRSSSVEAAATRRRRLVSVGTRRRPSS